MKLPDQIVLPHLTLSYHLVRTVYNNEPCEVWYQTTKAIGGTVIGFVFRAQGDTVHYAINWTWDAFVECIRLAEGT